MSHDMIVALQQKMGANFDAKAIMQRKKIEGDKCVQLLVEEIWQKQVLELIEKSRQSLGEKTITNEVLDETAKRLGK